MKLVNQDTSLRVVCHYLKERKIWPSEISDQCALAVFNIFQSAPDGQLTEIQLCKWFKDVDLPQFLLKHYWRAISCFSVNKRVSFYQFLFALCAMTAPHEPPWREIRDNYIFAGFDSDGNQQLDLLEFRILVYSILYTSDMVITLLVVKYIYMMLI